MRYLGLWSLWGLLCWPLPVLADITSNLVGYWAMDAGTGTTLVDSSATGLTVTFGSGGNAPTWLTPGKVGAAATTYASASSQRAQASVGVGHPLYPGTNNFTVAAWVKLVAGGGWRNIAGVWHGSDPYWYMRIQTAGQIGLVMQATGFLDTASSGTVTDTTNWHHVAVTVQRGGNATFYIDGSASGTSSTTGVTGSIVNTASRTFCLGCLGTITGTEFFNGSLDEVRVYNRLLSASDITELVAFTTQQPRARRPLIFSSRHLEFWPSLSHHRRPSYARR